MAYCMKCGKEFKTNGMYCKSCTPAPTQPSHDKTNQTVHPHEPHEKTSGTEFDATKAIELAKKLLTPTDPHKQGDRTEAKGVVAGTTECPSHIGLTIAALFLNPLFGFIALIASIQVIKLLSEGNVTQAQKASSRAKTTSIIAIAISIFSALSHLFR